MKAFLKIIFFVSFMLTEWCSASKKLSAPIQKPKSFWPGDAWPNATVVYELNWTLNSDNIRVFHEAVAEYETKTCVRFRPRQSNETDYVSVERFDLTCGVAHMCRWGGYQYVMIGGACFNKTVLLHELGHSLCLGHEDTRVDRDDYMDLSPCDLFPNPDKFDTRGHLYDYWSVMHYQCGFCEGGAGWPKMEGVGLENCGQAIPKGTGLSVLDADKINDFYNCQECFRHRWRRSNNFTDADLQSLVAFGQTNDSTPLYLCRGFVGPEIAPGKYNLEEDICYLSYRGKEYRVRERVQVFTVPTDSEATSSYELVEARSPTDNLVKVGRSVDGITQYAAVAQVEVGGIREIAIGKVYANDMTRAFIPIQGNELEVTNFQVVACV